MEDTKICYKCKQVKPFSEFNKCSRTKTGLHGHCRECQRKVKAKWVECHKEWVKEYSTLPEVKERVNEKLRQRYHSDQEWRDKQLEINRVRRRKEEAKVNARLQRNKWRSIPQNAIACSLRGRLHAALRGIIKTASTETLLGCSFLEFKKRLEQQFTPEMNWDNYGTFWHIDHIIPITYLSLEAEENQRILCHYLNLRPFPALENISKHNRIDPKEAEAKIAEIRKVLSS